MEWEVDGKRVRLDQSIAEPNMWRIVKEEGATEPSQEGLMMVYVDDALILSNDGVVNGLISRMKKTWELSNPEWLGEDAPVRILGMELRRKKDGSIFISQEAYIQDMLKRRGEEKGPISGFPITRDQAQRIEQPQSTTPTLDEVKQAQRITGELMWLLTRSRPDVMYVMRKMCQSTLKNPREVVEVGAQVIKYLRKTQAQGVCLTKEKGGLEVYTDSSFGPGGNDSQGTVIVMWGGVVAM